MLVIRGAYIRGACVRGCLHSGFYGMRLTLISIGYFIRLTFSVDIQPAIFLSQMASIVILPITHLSISTVLSD